MDIISTLANVISNGGNNINLGKYNNFIIINRGGYYINFGRYNATSGCNNNQ